MMTIDDLIQILQFEGIRNQTVLQVMIDVPRERFVPLLPGKA
jgi:protein-L-isoaspartate O-methyltransferase